MRPVARLAGFLEGSLFLVTFLVLLVFVVGYGFQYVWETRTHAGNTPPGSMVAYSGGQDPARHWLCQGSGKAARPVILIAPLGNGAAWWSTIQKQLAQDRVVCAHDRPGIGWSRQDLTVRDQRLLAGELRQGMDAFALERAVVIGVGFGANLAYNFAEFHPDRVSRVILIDPHTIHSLYRGTTRQEPLVHPMRRSLTRRRWAAEFGLGRLLQWVDPQWPGPALLPEGAPPVQRLQQLWRTQRRAAQMEMLELQLLVAHQQNRNLQTRGVVLTSMDPPPFLVQAARGRVELAADRHDRGIRALLKRNPRLRGEDLNVRHLQMPHTAAGVLSDRLGRLIRAAP